MERNALLAGALVLLSGCAGPVLTQRADTIAPGRVQGHVGVNFGAAYDGVAVVPLPTVAGSVRVGLADGVDAGLTAWNLGARLDTKIRLFHGDRVTLALALGVETTFVSADVLAALEIDSLLSRASADEWTFMGWGLPLLLQLEEHDFAFIVALPVAIGGYEANGASGLAVDTGLALALDVYTGSDTSLFIQTAVLTRAGDQTDTVSLFAGEDSIRFQLFIGGNFGGRD